MKLFCLFLVFFAAQCVSQTTSNCCKDAIYIEGEFKGTVDEVITIHNFHKIDDSYTEAGRIYRDFLEPYAKDAGHWRFQLFIDGTASIEFTALLEPIYRLDRTWLGISSLDRILRKYRGNTQQLNFKPLFTPLQTALLNDASIYFGPEFEAAFLPDQILPIQHTIDRRLAALQQELEDDSDFIGLYLLAQQERDLDTNNEAQRLGLQWEFLNDGWRESKRTKGKSRIDAAFDQLQLRANLHLQQFDAKLYALKTLRNRARYRHYQAKIEHLDSLSERKQRQLEEGFLTISEFEEFNLRRARAYQLFSLYRNIQHGGLSPYLRQLLNSIEAQRLKSPEQLVDIGKINSLDLARVDLQIDRTEYYPDYWDNASVRLYVEERESLTAVAPTDSVAGIRVELPLDFNRSRRSIINNQKQNYQSQRAAIAIRLEQNIRSVRQQFYERAAELDELIRRRKSLFANSEVLNEMAAGAIATIDATPEKDLEILQYNKITNGFDILEKRIDCLALAMRLSYLVNADLNTLFH